MRPLLGILERYKVYSYRIEAEHIKKFMGHKMADYVWDVRTSTRKQVQVGAHDDFHKAHRCSMAIVKSFTLNQVQYLTKENPLKISFFGDIL